ASSKPTQAALSPDSATSAIESLDARCSRLHRNLFDFYVCVNRTNYLDMLKQFQRNVEESREFEVPIFATIISVYCLFILFGLFGNGMVILTVWRNRSMRNARNIFIVNLAVSDFILCLLTQPMNIMRLFPNFISWEFGRLLCKVVNTLTGLNMFVSTFSITAIALDRFQVIVYPTRTRMSRHAMTLCLAAIWGSAGLMASPLALFADIQHHPINFGRDFNARVNKICSEITTRIFVKYAKLAYSSGVLVVQYLVPLGIVSMRDQQGEQKQKTPQQPVSAYRKNRQAAEALRQRRANRLLVTIAIVFCLSWLPLTIVNIVHDFRVLKVKEEFEREDELNAIIRQQNKSFPKPTFNEGLSIGNLTMNSNFRVGLDSARGANSDVKGGSTSSKSSQLAVAASQSIPLLLVLVSACLNPVFYGWFNENFQSEFYRLLCLKSVGPSWAQVPG
uniref:G_PROTEIN_RECEP_F1_2 domain-containing protein n=1 Tax=Macrostomum lignano TaxID=282301 RepID=A0A1I8FF20_9PLAT